MDCDAVHRTAHHPRTKATRDVRGIERGHVASLRSWTQCRAVLHPFWGVVVGWLAGAIIGVPALRHVLGVIKSTSLTNKLDEEEKKHMRDAGHIARQDYSERIF